MTETNSNIEDIPEMSQTQSNDWIGKHWPIMLTVFTVIIWGIRQESAISSNTEKNYRLYLQFDEYKKEDKADNKDLVKAVDEMKLSLNTLIANFNNLDSRYPLRRELDARYFKTAFRENK